MYCLSAVSLFFFFFFQAEDGIRDVAVTEFRRVLFRSREALAARLVVHPATRCGSTDTSSTPSRGSGTHFRATSPTSRSRRSLMMGSRSRRSRLNAEPRVHSRTPREIGRAHV